MTTERSDGAQGLRRLRQRRGWSWADEARALRDTARRLGIPGVAEASPAGIQRSVARWESATAPVCPGDRYRLLLAHTFADDHGKVALGPGTDFDHLMTVLTDYGISDHEIIELRELVASTVVSDRFPTEHDAADLVDWINTTDTTDEAIERIAQAARFVADSHTRLSPGRVLDDVARLHRKIQSLLRGDRKRLRQIRELLRIDAALLAHACILLGDLHRDRVALTYGAASSAYAEEAGDSPAAGLSAQAKTERWRHRYAVSADLARQGFERSPTTPLRILLASQEANAAGLLGDIHRARQALKRAQDAAHSSLAEDSGTSPWSCPRPRQALYALSVATRTGEPDAALQAAKSADAAWASGEPWANATWAQSGDQGRLYWHILLGEHTVARELAREARRRLDGLSGFNPTPERWLHITVLIAGTTEQITDEQTETMITQARHRLAATPPIPIRLGRLFYHPEAIALPVRPSDALTPVLRAAQAATRTATGVDGVFDHRPWTPHLTVTYSTSTQPAAPIIAALGRTLGEYEIIVDALSLVAQHGPEHLWDWHPIATMPLEGEDSATG